MYDAYADIESATWPNGLTIYCKYIPNVPQYMGFVVYTGSGEDPSDLPGLAHFVEHIALHCSKVNRKALSNFFKDRSGRDLSANTCHSSTDYSFALPSDIESISKAINLFGQILLKAQFNQVLQEIESERLIIAQEFRSKYPSELSYKIASDRRFFLFGDSFHGNNFGDLESIAKISAGELQKFYDQHYTPKNISVLCVGGLPLQVLTKLFEDSPFAEPKDGQRCALPKSNFVGNSNNHAVNIVYNNFQGSLYEEVIKIPADFNIISVGIYTEMLKDKLFEILRERHGIIYGVTGCYPILFSPFYGIKFSFDFSPAVSRKDILLLVDEVVNSIATDEGLFNKIKNKRLRQIEMIDLSAKNIFDGAFDELIGSHRLLTLTEYLATVENLTSSDITDITKCLARWTVIVGQESNLEKTPPASTN